MCAYMPLHEEAVEASAKEERCNKVNSGCFHIQQSQHHTLVAKRRALIHPIAPLPAG